MMPAGPVPERLGTPRKTDRTRNAANGASTSGGTFDAVGAPAHAWQLLQVRVSREVWAWTHRLAILTRANPGEVVEKAIHALARIESQKWPEEDLPKLGRYRGRYILVHEHFTKRVIERRPRALCEPFRKRVVKGEATKLTLARRQRLDRGVRGFLKDELHNDSIP